MHGFTRTAVLFLVSILALAVQAQSQVSFKKKSGSEVMIYVNGDYFSSFLFDQSLPKPVLYPVIDAKQNRITRGYPFQPIPGERADHPHHYGIWLNFGDVNKVDFWNNGKYPGTAAEHNYGSILLNNSVSLNEKKGTISYSAIWKGPDGAELIKEETTYFFSGNDSTTEVTRESRLKALRDLEFGDSKEGFFAIRVRRELESPSTTKDQYVKDTTGAVSQNKRHDSLIPVTGLYINSEADSGAAVWGKPANWVMLRGKIENKDIAIIMLDHPGNFGHPARWMARDYGLFGVNPYGEKSYGGNSEKITPLKKGSVQTFRYKIIFTTFIPEKAYIEKQHKQFSSKNN